MENLRGWVWQGCRLIFSGFCASGRPESWDVVLQNLAGLVDLLKKPNAGGVGGMVSVGDVCLDLAMLI